MSGESRVIGGRMALAGSSPVRSMHPFVAALVDLRGQLNKEPSAGAAVLGADLLDLLEGVIGVPEVPVSAATTPNLSLTAAGVLTHLGRSRAAFELLVRFAPRSHPEIASLGFDVLADVEPGSLFAHRAWISQFFAACMRTNLAEMLPQLVRELHLRGHFDLVAALRSSKLATLLRPQDFALMDASFACWLGHYGEVTRHLGSLSFEGQDRDEADLLLAIAAGAATSTPPPRAFAELERLSGRDGSAQRLRKVADRWRADWEGHHPTSGKEPFRGGTEHPAVRLVHRDAHEPRTSDLWILDQLRAEGVAAAGEIHRLYWHDPLAARARIYALFGGNRNDACTVTENGGLRLVRCRTARQHAIELQATLIDRGPEAVLAEFRQLADTYADTAPFQTYAAEILLWLGRYEEAAELFATVGRTDPAGWKQRWVAIGLGAALAHMGRDAEAEAAWKEGARLNGLLPGEASLTYRAAVAMRRGALSTGAELLRGALAATPTRLRAWIQLAEVCWLLDSPAEARTALHRAATLCPGLFTTLPAAPSALDPVLRRDDGIDLCRTIRNAMLGNASSWVFTWRDASGEWRAFRHIVPDRLERAIEWLRRLEGSTTTPGAHDQRLPQ